MQLDLFASRAARNTALQTVADNSGDFMEQGLSFLTFYTPGRELTGEDIRFKLTNYGITPHDPHAWGALISTAIKRKLLIPTQQFVSMRDKSSHARMTRVYRVGQGG